MAEVVYVLGAGFNYSVLDPNRARRPPLAKNFFQVLQEGAFDELLPGIRGTIYIDVLLEEIRRYWHLDLAALKTEPFDIEGCLTLFESLQDESDEDRRLTMGRASFALRNLLLMYLGELSPAEPTPTARQFGQAIFEGRADVLTFNYDTIVEDAIESASGPGQKLIPRNWYGPENLNHRQELPDEDLDAGTTKWRRALAYGFQFDEVPLPVPGIPEFFPRSRYYSHPNNQLYQHSRVLKLHGSIDWLLYTNTPIHPEPKGVPAQQASLRLFNRIPFVQLRSAWRRLPLARLFRGGPKLELGVPA